MAGEASPTPVEAAVSAANFSALQATRLPLQRHCRGFTLVELLVTMGVLVLLVFLATQLINSAATVTVLGYKKMDADSEARQVFDRMAFDFQQMLKRSDVDYFLKASATASDCGACGVQTGNDQAAFYSTVPGYYAVPTPTPVGSPIAASPVSLVSYRVNSDSTASSYNRLERMGKSLPWNGVSSSLTPVVFLPQKIGANWPAACYPVCNPDPTYKTDPSYEVIGPQVFRFEYYYLLKNGSFSATPWDAISSVRGLQDVSAIVVAIAVIDPKSKVLVTDAQIATVTGTLIDYGAAAAVGCPSPSWQSPGELRRQWQCVLDSTNGLPRPAISGIRVYERYFYLTH
jgi:prepilin-type N-terminal cleavage/methylation domain-containing protein